MQLLVKTKQPGDVTVIVSLNEMYPDCQEAFNSNPYSMSHQNTNHFELNSTG